MQRNWIIDGDPLIVEDEEQLADAIFEATRILSRVGGKLYVVPDRRELSPGVYQTVRYAFGWESFQPAVKEFDEPLEGEAGDVTDVDGD